MLDKLNTDILKAINEISESQGIEQTTSSQIGDRLKFRISSSVLENRLKELEVEGYVSQVLDEWKLTKKAGTLINVNVTSGSVLSETLHKDKSDRLKNIKQIKSHRKEIRNEEKSDENLTERLDKTETEVLKLMSQGRNLDEICLLLMKDAVEIENICALLVKKGRLTSDLEVIKQSEPEEVTKTLEEREEHTEEVIQAPVEESYVEHEKEEKSNKDEKREEIPKRDVVVFERKPENVIQPVEQFPSRHEEDVLNKNRYEEEILARKNSSVLSMQQTNAEHQAIIEKKDDDEKKRVLKSGVHQKRQRITIIIESLRDNRVIITPIISLLSILFFEIVYYSPQLVVSIDNILPFEIRTWVILLVSALIINLACGYTILKQLRQNGNFATPNVRRQKYG
jgi:DNA-binding HxlR family transcriptional regulator/DNA-binding CsgD family transcriptional regulator